MNAPDRFRLIDASIRLDSVPNAGRDIALRPSAEERAELASDLGIIGVDALEVELHAQKFHGGFRVTGELTATIQQPSVVSLEPVTQTMVEPIDRVFLPIDEKRYAASADAEVFVDIEGEDVPDHFEGVEADLTELIRETIALAIDPYPRAEGESLDLLGIKLDNGKESPFAVLAALKPKKPGS